ncbi:hypothetical protein Y695_03425 [Hydrogenophaga sp. T4]|nr:hypothetical protein Y695_03425 [Hydrogenophaga sp. T4]
MAMNTALSSNSCPSGEAAAGSTNCGRKARKKIVSLGLRMFNSSALTTMLRPERCEAWLSTAKALRSFQVAQAT